MLFAGNLRSNLTLKNVPISDDNLIAAIRLAGLESLIAGSSQGIAMPIREGGGNLSGGQRQAIAIARAFTGTPIMALLDEPTNFMDGLIVSSHKNALLSLVDRVIVVDQGRMVFDGTKEAFTRKFYPPARSG